MPIPDCPAHALPCHKDEAGYFCTKCGWRPQKRDPWSYEDLLHALNETFSDYDAQTDNEGQIVIYTGLKRGEGDILEAFDAD